MASPSRAASGRDGGLCCRGPRALAGWLLPYRSACCAGASRARVGRVDPQCDRRHTERDKRAPRRCLSVGAGERRPHRDVHPRVRERRESAWRGVGVRRERPRSSVDVRVAASAVEVWRGRRGETSVDAGLVREPVGGPVMAAYYNEIDAGAAQWLRNLIAAGLIAPGDVDERSISDVRADDLVGYSQCHFFAGIGGWSYALRLAGWPDDRPVWTGSCPCQPFSSAGRGGGFADERHLWPEFFRLIRQCRPEQTFGEQVGSALGRTWLSAVRADLESVGYAVGAADLCAAGIGAPHIRQRLYWVADAGRISVRGAGPGQASGAEGQARGEAGQQRLRADTRSGGAADVVGVADRDRGGLPRDGERNGNAQPRQGQRDDLGGRGEVCGGLGDADHAGLARRPSLRGHDGAQQSAAERAGGWATARLVECSDGRARPVPVEPALFPLAHGIPGIVGSRRSIGRARRRILKGSGNAIVPQLAAEFVSAWCET